MFKKKDILLETLENISDNLHSATVFFSAGLKKPLNLSSFAKEMKDFETKGDKFTHSIIIELNKTFITPIEREDIMALTTSLDDVLDGIEACASRLDMYQIQQPDEFILQFADILVQNAVEIQAAIRLLSVKKLLPMRQHTIRINDLENEADDLLRASIKKLFAEVTDPILLIKKKEIYEMLESATDDCEDVADTLETIIMSNS